MDPVVWERVGKNAGEASRTDGVRLGISEGVWLATKGSTTLRLKVPALLAYLDRAIGAADILFPPPPWQHENGVWAANGWTVRPVENGGYGVFRTRSGGTEERASRQTFDSADRGRAWAALRFDRGDGGLRGPRARAGAPAASKLPDIRVTHEERALAEKVLDRLNLSYSEFVRAALRWTDDHMLSEQPTWSVLRDGDVRFEKVEPA